MSRQSLNDLEMLRNRKLDSLPGVFERIDIGIVVDLLLGSYDSFYLFRGFLHYKIDILTTVKLIIISWICGQSGHWVEDLTWFLSSSWPWLLSFNQNYCMFIDFVRHSSVRKSICNHCLFWGYWYSWLCFDSFGLSYQHFSRYLAIPRSLYCFSLFQHVLLYCIRYLGI